MRTPTLPIYRSTIPPLAAPSRDAIEGSDREPRDMSGKTKLVAPLALFTKEGDLEWNRELVAAIRDKGKLKSGQT